MAKSEDKQQDKAAEAAAPAPAATEVPAAQAPQAQAAQAQAPQRVEVEDADVVSAYANFCRVNGTPEELIIDFGLNSQPFGAPEKPLKVTQRLVVNYYTAKRLLGALQLSIQRHEAAFGVLETNVQKRVLPAAMRQAAQ